MKIIDFTIEIPKGKRSAEIHVVGDVHRGNKYFDEPLWDWYSKGSKNHLGFKTDKNVYVVCVGDLMETSLQLSAGVQDQVEWIEDQYLWTKEWLTSIAEEGRLIGLAEGNHERRASKNWIRTTRLLGKELGVPYSAGILVVNIKLIKGMAERKYKLCFAHGKGWSRTVGGKFNACYRLNAIVGDADAYVIGHLHEKMSIVKRRYMNGKLKDVLYGITGAFLEYGGYGEESMYSPPAAGCLKLKLHCDIDRVSAR